jgi:hypothetical protein
VEQGSIYATITRITGVTRYIEFSSLGVECVDMLSNI